MRRARRKERGFALTAFALLSLALFAFAAVGVDTGRLALTANEVQAEADIAATAGAQALLDGGTADTARSHAQTVVQQNAVNGSGATIQPAQIEVGQYNYQSKTFINGATPSSAVRATPSTTVQNLFVGILGSSFANTTVTKTATAGFTGLGEAAATLPLALGDCHFPELSSCFQDASCLPRLSQVPSTTDNTGWTSFFDGSSSGNSIADYMPSACGGKNTPPVVKVGDAISLNNGESSGKPLKAVEDCVEKKGITKFLVPIVGCDGNFNQSGIVTGFATVIVESVQAPPESPKGLTLHAIFEEVQGTPGGGAYGTGEMRLLN
jgi:Flp pilus assembly protein TadG